MSQKKVPVVLSKKKKSWKLGNHGVYACNPRTGMERWKQACEFQASLHYMVDCIKIKQQKDRTRDFRKLLKDCLEILNT